MYRFLHKLPYMNLIPRILRSDLDDKPRKNIVWVVDMWILLDDKWVAALVADGVEGFAFSHHVYFVTRQIQDLIPSSQKWILF